MRDRFIQYFLDCSRLVPTWLYVGLFLLFFSGTVSLIICKGPDKGIRWSARLLLIEYLFLLLSLTVLFRPILAERVCYLIPSHSCQAFQVGGRRVIETIMNVVVFIPVGGLLGYSVKSMKWWGVLLFGCGFSLFVETLQFVFKRGFAEFEDVFQNVLGCMIGFGIYVTIVFTVQFFKQASCSPK